MWADEKTASWWGPWYGLSHCGKCHTLITGVACPKCRTEFTPTDWQNVSVDGVAKRVPQYATEGTISWTTYVLLDLMRREWQRPIAETESSHRLPEKQPSQRMIIVILFWTLFEHLMDRFFAAATCSLPSGMSDLLRRYAGIGSRMDRLYRMLFDTTLQRDLVSVGHGSVYEHLVKVRDKRNRFVHGESEVIDDGLVYETVEKLHDVQAAWIAVYNLRCTGKLDAPPVWQGSSPF